MNDHFPRTFEFTQVFVILPYHSDPEKSLIDYELRDNFAGFFAVV